MSTNPAIAAIRAPLADRDAVYPAAKQPDGTIFHAQDAPFATFICRIDPATQAHFWDPIAGGVASTGWPPYVVSTGDPAAPYALPSAAVAAALANGHGPANPVDVLIFPGTYAEAAELDLPGGINLVAFTGQNDGQTVISAPGAGVVVAGSGAATTTLAGLTLACPLTVLGAGSGSTFLRRCSVTGGTTMGNVHGAQLFLDLCTLTAPGGTAALTTSAGAVGAVARDAVVVAGAGAPALRLNGASSQFSGSAGLVTGQVVLGAGAAATFVGGKVATGVAGDLFQIGAGATVVLDRGVSINNVAGTRLASGPGTLSIRDLAAAGSQAVDPATLQSAASTVRVYTKLVVPVVGGTTVLTAAQVTEFDLVLLSGVGSTVQLPLTTTVPTGARVTIAWNSGTGANVNPTAPDKVAGAAGQAFGPSFSAATYQNDPSLGDWTQVATYSPPIG